MNDRHWFGFSRTVISVAVAMAAAPVLAQNTTSAVGGRIVDGSGKPVAGATVTVRHEESGSTNTTTSDADGRYALRGADLAIHFPAGVTERRRLASGAEILQVLQDLFHIRVPAEPEVDDAFDRAAREHPMQAASPSGQPS